MSEKIKNPIRRALISVSDKTGLIPFAQYLAAQKAEILSTGGTLKALQEAGIPAIPVESFTGFPEILEGRVKTLHPKIHGGLLYRRDKKSHEEEARKHGILPIDLVVVNLYPFEEVTRNLSVDFETAVENIDIGGPSMLRSAAKNFEAVAVICDPADYPAVIEEMKARDGDISEDLRRHLALKVFERTSKYDRAISEFLKNQNGKQEKTESPLPNELPEKLKLHYSKERDLRYGENPHQKASFYLPESSSMGKPGLAYTQLHGKELSFNNLLDIEAAVDVTDEFEEPAACVVKHSNPCGIAQAETPAKALQAAIECDELSAFGGILGINRACDLETARLAFDKLKFFEVFVAPGFEPDALEFLKKRPNLRLIEIAASRGEGLYDLRFLQSSLLVQTRDLPLRLRQEELTKTLRFVTQAKMEGSGVDELFFAFKCVKVVKSNAIVLAQDYRTVGIGAGQMSRVDSVEIACRKAGERARGAFLASDAFFPIPDSIEVAHKHGIRAIIQPGGSVRDKDVIEACDRFGIAMVFTAERHFRH